MYNVVCFGFGRMGMTHLSLLNGYLGAHDTRVTIVDNNFVSRVMARILYPRAKIYRYGKRFLKEVKGIEVDFVIVATPPHVREEVLQVFRSTTAKILVEKPVRVPLEPHMMSGYVLQHAPLTQKVRKKLEHNLVRRVSASIITNVNFEAAGSSWRSGRFGNVLHEFGGHVLSVVASCMSDKMFYDIDENSLLSISECSRNKILFLFQSNDVEVEVDLQANRDDVRKASYNFKFYDESGDLLCKYDLYNFVTYENGKITQCENIASNGINVDYYLRGFEFSLQIQNLINSKGDWLSREQIAGIECILDMVD